MDKQFQSPELIKPAVEVESFSDSGNSGNVDLMSGEEMPNLTERLSQYPDMQAKRGGDDTGSIMGGMSIRNGSQ